MIHNISIVSIHIDDDVIYTMYIYPGQLSFGLIFLIG